MSDYFLTQGNTGPALGAVLRNPDGTPVDLTGCTVQMVSDLPSQTGTASAVVTSRITLKMGTVRYDPGALDTAETGTFHITWRVIESSGRAIDYPNNGTMVLTIVPRIDA